MAVRHREVNLTYEMLEALCSERQTMLHTLRQQNKDLGAERDQARRGLELMTEALRRRGCCDDHTNGVPS